MPSGLVSGHTPGVHHARVVLGLELLDHRARRRRTADHHGVNGAQGLAFLAHVVEQHAPDGRHAGGHRDLFGVEQLPDAGTVEARGRASPPWRRPAPPRTGCPKRWRGTSARRGEPIGTRRCRACRPGTPYRRAIRSSDGCRARPWDCRWCPRCSTATTRSPRRSAATRSRRPRRRRALRNSERSAARSPACARRR